MTSFINLTSHSIDIVRSDGSRLSVPPSGQIARREEIVINTNSIDGIETAIVVFGGVLGVPDPQENTIYIVSTPCLEVLTHRDDIVSPTEFLRSDDGRVIACHKLKRVDFITRLYDNELLFEIGFDGDDHKHFARKYALVGLNKRRAFKETLEFDLRGEAIKAALAELVPDNLHVE